MLRLALIRIRPMVSSSGVLCGLNSSAMRLPRFEILGASAFLAFRESTSPPNRPIGPPCIVMFPSLWG